MCGVRDGKYLFGLELRDYIKRHLALSQTALKTYSQDRRHSAGFSVWAGFGGTAPAETEQGSADRAMLLHSTESAGHVMATVSAGPSEKPFFSSISPS